MNTTTVKHDKTYLITYSLYIIFLVSLIFSFRAISSMSIAAILLAGIIARFLRPPFPIHNKYRLYFVLGCTIVFLLTMVAILYTKDVREGWNSVRIKTGLLITTLAVYLCWLPGSSLLRKLLFHFCLVLTIASLYCLGIAIARYQESANVTVFFYHSLVKPISQHAIYFSLLTLFGLVFLWENIKKNHFFVSRLFHFCLLVFFSFFLFLLSSKLILSFYVVTCFTFSCKC